jgi:hypothetical protein
VGRLYPTNPDGTPGDDAEAPYVTQIQLYT